MRRGRTSDRCRSVLDETSFDFRGISDREIEEHLDVLCDGLETIRGASHPDLTIESPSTLWDVECLDGCAFCDFLCSPRASGVSRDTRVRLQQILNKLQELDSRPEDTSVRVDGAEATHAVSVAHALERTVAGHCTACMVFGAVSRRGLLPVTGSAGRASVFFFAEPSCLPDFWRHVLRYEDISEKYFFELCEVAFPALRMHPDLAFRRFDGKYSDLRERVVQVLSGLCDHFPAAHRDAQGLPDAVQAALGPHHVDVSPESPGTHRSDRLRRQRVVEFDGREHRCEWHAKLERHRNRIHFALIEDGSPGTILIGIFTSHLDT